jgi:hypothetical protein
VGFACAEVQIQPGGSLAGKESTDAVSTQSSVL